MCSISASRPDGSMPSDLLHYEDFEVGSAFPLGPYTVTAEEILLFAREFDPQPFHLSDEAARATLLGGLSASGWHSCAMLMRMLVDAYLHRTAGMGSNGLDEVKWLKPVRAGETLHGTVTVTDRRISARKPGRGILKLHAELFNARGDKKLELTGVNLVAVRRP
jgi:acyl dehydratase